MRPEHFSKSSPGDLVQVLSGDGERGWAFLPHPLPPDTIFSSLVWQRAESAAHALGRLDTLGSILPDPMILINPFASREALASTRIEGTRAEFEQLVMADAFKEMDQFDPDLQEVVNYMAAMSLGWNRLPDWPFSVTFMADIHRQLLQDVRGQKKQPGALRTRLVWIGSRQVGLSQARFVPPPPADVRPMLETLVEYMSTSSVEPVLVKLALIHYQFETIHPFNDGNGRLGRLLMPLMLKEWGRLEQPLLFLSEYFENRRDDYIDKLFEVSRSGAWEEWVLFVLDAVEHQSLDALDRGTRLLAFREELRANYQANRAGRILSVIDMLFYRPTLTITHVAEQVGITYPAAKAIVQNLVRDGLLVEYTGRKRDKAYIAPEIMAAILGRPSRIEV